MKIIDERTHRGVPLRPLGRQQKLPLGYQMSQGSVAFR
jgi:hypothetical protein